MKVRMKTTMAGPDGGASAGSVVDLAPATAERLVHGGYAVYVVDVPAKREKPVEEVAVQPEPPETAMTRARGRPRKLNAIG